MTTVMKKRVRILSLGSDSEDIDQGNPKTRENGKSGGKRRNLGDNKAIDIETALKSNTCFVCDEKDSWVLVCHAEECPLAIHQSCASDDPDFDKFGNYYCPYCWYKLVVAKSIKLRTMLMVTEKCSKSRDNLGGIDLGLMMDEITEDVGNVVELNVSGDRSVTSVNPSGNSRDGGESYKEFMVMEKDQRMKEVVAESHSREVSNTDDADVDEVREQPGRYSEKNHETSDACGERFSGKNLEKMQVRNSDVDDEIMQQRRCDINNETAQVQGIDAGVETRKQRFYSQKSQSIKRVARTQKQGVFSTDEGPQVCDSDFSEVRSEQGFFSANKNQKKTSSIASCVQEVPRTDKRVSHGSELGEGKCLQGRHIEKNQHNKKVESETQEKEVPKLEGKDEQVERQSVSSSISSPMSIHNVNASHAASQELALIVHPKAHLPAGPIEARPYCSVSSKKPSFQPEKYGDKSYLEKNGAASNDPGQSKFIVCSDKRRKRLFWTQAEEEMLRAGVQKFPGVRNIPWRKILEYGREVFHEERLPSDLKDKWKKINKMFGLPTE